MKKRVGYGINKATLVLSFQFCHGMQGHIKSAGHLLKLSGCALRLPCCDQGCDKWQLCSAPLGGCCTCSLHTSYHTLGTKDPCWGLASREWVGGRPSATGDLISAVGSNCRTSWAYLWAWNPNPTPGSVASSADWPFWPSSHRCYQFAVRWTQRLLTVMPRICNQVM